MKLFYAKRIMDLAYLPKKGINKCIVLAFDYRITYKAKKDGYKVLHIEEILKKDIAWDLYNKGLLFAKQILEGHEWSIYEDIKIGKALMGRQPFYRFLLLAEYLYQATLRYKGEVIYINDGSIEGEIAHLIGENNYGSTSLNKSYYREVKYYISHRSNLFDFKEIILDQCKKIVRRRDHNPILQAVEKGGVSKAISRIEKPDVMVSIFGQCYNYMALTMRKLKENGLDVEIITLNNLFKSDVTKITRDGFACCQLTDFTKDSPPNYIKNFQQKYAKYIPEFIDWAQGRFKFRDIDITPVIIRLSESYFRYWFPRLAVSTDVIMNLFSGKSPKILLSLSVYLLEDHIACQVASNMGIKALGVKHGIDDKPTYVMAALEVTDKFNMESRDIAEAYIKEGINPGKIIVIGSLWADYVVNHKFSTLDVVKKTLKIKDKLRPYILFMPQPINTARYCGFAYDIPIEKISLVVRMLKAIPEYELIIKLHRTDNKKRYDYLLPNNNVHFTRRTDQFSLMKHCELLIAERGTEISEALLVDIDMPIVLFDRLSLVDHMHNVGFDRINYRAEGAFEIAENAEELIPAILKAIKEKGRKKAARLSFLKKYVGITDGNSWSRLGEEVMRLVNPVKRKTETLT